MAALAVLLALFLATSFDWNQAKPWLHARISEAAGRPFAVHGALALTWTDPPMPQSGWRNLLPWPRIAAENIALGGPSEDPNLADLARIRRATFSVDPLALLKGELFIPELELDQPSIVLQRRADGRNNWSIQADDRILRSIRVEGLRLADGSLRFIDESRKLDAQASIVSRPDKDAGGRIAWSLSGSLDGKRIDGSATTAGILSLKDASHPFPVDATFRIGKSAVVLEGTVARQADSALLDMLLNVSGDSMADLYPATGVALPPTPLFSLGGRLRGRIAANGAGWRFDDFRGRMGSSGLAGSLRLETAGARPRLTGEVASDLLQMHDLMMLFGAEAASVAVPVRRTGSRHGNRHTATDIEGRVLPTRAIRTDRWTSTDVDVKLTARKILRYHRLPVENLAAGLRLDNGVMTLELLEIGASDGRLDSTVTLDGRQRTIKAQLALAARGLGLKQLFPVLQAMKEGLGEIDGQASLSASGNSVAALLGSVTGNLSMKLGRANLSRLLLDEIGLPIDGMVLSRLFGDGRLRIRCLNADIRMHEGLAVPRSFVVDTDESLVFIDGRVNFVNEQIELIAELASREPMPVSSRMPLQIVGRLGDPVVRSIEPVVQHDVVNAESFFPAPMPSHSIPAGCGARDRPSQPGTGGTELRPASFR